MKKAIQLTISSIFVLLTAVQTLHAQAATELQIFQDKAADRSVIFRGRQSARYNFLANGHPYWEQTAFESGDIVIEGNLYRDVTVNIDAVAQRVLVQLPGSPFSVALAPAQVSSLTINGRQFVGVGPGERLPEGIYEIFGQGTERVFKHVRKRLDNSVANVNGSTIGYYDENYRSNVYRHFAHIASYYFRDTDGQFSPIKGKGALIRKFPDRRREIRRGLKAAGLLDADFDTCCKAILNIVAP